MLKKGLIILSMLVSITGLSQDTLKITDLDTATVTVRKAFVTTRIDGFLYDARQAPSVASQTAIDLLRKLPGVQVNLDGFPTMRGSSQIKVFIDGKPSTVYAATVMDALRQLPSDAIAKVEIITHPSAKYDGEGVDGVINIFTKRRLADGSSGSVNALAGPRFQQLTGNLAWRRRQWIIRPDAGVYHTSNRVVYTLRRHEGTSDLVQQGTTEDASPGNYGGINILYLPDSLTTISTGYRYGYMRNNRSIIATYDVSDGSGFASVTDNPNQRYIHSISWGLSTKSRNKTAEYNFLGSWFYQGQQMDFRQRQVRDTGSAHLVADKYLTGNSELALQADVSKSFGKIMTLEAGVRCPFRKFENQSNADNFWFRWITPAAYVNYTIDLHGWQVRIGGRYEQTHWPLHFRDTFLALPDYRNFLPNMIISRKLSPAHSLSAGYARKLIRPYINYLNPVVNYIDPLNLEYGNPGLRPAISHNYDLNYTFRRNGWLFNASFFINQTKNSIQSIRVSLPGGIVATTYGNVADQLVMGGTLHLSYQGEKLTFNINNTLRRLAFPSRHGMIVNGSLDLSYRPGGGFTAGVLYSCNTKEITVQGQRTGWQRYSFTMNKDFMDGKLGISLQLDNPFTPYRIITEESEGYGFYQIAHNQYLNRFFRLGVSYKFGKKEVRLPAAKTISTEN